MSLRILPDRVVGCIVAGAVGDAMGGPYEGRRGPLVYVPPDLWHISDDTQMTLATCEAIIQCGRVDPETIAARFLAWFREDRITGIGGSTLKALRDLNVGAHWALSGARGEMAAGNGAAMRAAPLSFLLDPDKDADRTTLRDVCRITHHNDEAYIGALAIVYAVRLVALGDHPLDGSLLRGLVPMLPDSRVRDRLSAVADSAAHGSLQECAQRFGASGYVVDSVPLSLLAASTAAELGIEAMLRSAIECGGDTDTIASMAGQIAGAACGISGIPTDLQARLPEREKITELASALARIAS